MADNTALLADLAEVQRTNKELTQKLAASSHQLAVLQRAQGEAASGGPADAIGANAAATSGQGSQHASHAQPGGPSLQKCVSMRSMASLSQAVGQPTARKRVTAHFRVEGLVRHVWIRVDQHCNQHVCCCVCCRLGRSQGVRFSGELVPASEGRYFEAAMRQQRSQLADLQAALDATTGVVALQAAHITRLQEHAGVQADPLESLGQSAESQAVGRSKSCSPSATTLSQSTRPRTAEGCRAPPNTSAEKVAALRAHSPASSMINKRPATSNHQGMMACLKSDLEAWRAK